MLAAFALLTGGLLALSRAWVPERPLWLAVLLVFVIPTVAWNYILGFVFYLQHTHPDTPWFDRADEWSAYCGKICGTVHVDCPTPYLPLLKNGLKHTAHHAFPTVPIYALPKAQKKLLAKFGEDMVRYRLTLDAIGRIYRVCKLYDYRRRCWIDFEGHPTSAPWPGPKPA